MKKLILSVAVSLFATSLAPSALAATAQQNKMKECNTEAAEKELKGEERKTFMKGCLSAKPAKPTQQDKMKACNKDAGAKALKGDERKAFMSDCLKN
ncbi:PsiF family protein [Zoogloea sp.]|uniref:PsiF family protein n=1 Tax=Zoogloea sp. TaxID=49181 RepID=UPI0026228CB6|nr:PsiF family protein [Zoogloea sp.]MDD3353047.1 PsiF family protein [Zoogloea sp.]